MTAGLTGLSISGKKCTQIPNLQLQFLQQALNSSLWYPPFSNTFLAKTKIAAPMHNGIAGQSHDLTDTTLEVTQTCLDLHR